MKGSDFVWILYLNDMRSAQVENVQPVARAESVEALMEFLARERVPSYLESHGYGHWGKNYRKGGPLEWFNPPHDWDNAAHFRHLPRVVDYSDEIDVLPQVMSDAQIRAGAVGVLEQSQKHVTHRSELRRPFVQPSPGGLVEVEVAETLPFASGHVVHVEMSGGTRLVGGYRVEHVYNGGRLMQLCNLNATPGVTVGAGAGYYVARDE